MQLLAVGLKTVARHRLGDCRKQARHQGTVVVTAVAVTGCRLSQRKALQEVEAYSTGRGGVRPHPRAHSRAWMGAPQRFPPQGLGPGDKAE